MNVGIDKLGLIHLNNSAVEFGSRIDRHMNSGYGKIWKDSDLVLGYFLDKFKEIPMVCETELGDTREIMEKFFPEIIPQNEPLNLILEQY